MKSSFLPPPREYGSGMIVAVASIVVAAMLTACTLTRPSPVKHTYLLEPAAPAAAAATKPATLRMGTLTVAAPFRSRQLVYRVDDLKYESDFYSEFFVAPAPMLAEATSRALVSAKVFKRVIPPGASPDEGDFLLEGFVTDLYGDARDMTKPAGVMSITYYLSALNPTGPSVIWSREYQQRVPISGTSSDAVVRAWNTALTSILADLVQDLSTASLSQK